MIFLLHNFINNKKKQVKLMPLTIIPHPLSTADPISPVSSGIDLISDLPNEIKMQIFGDLDIKDILQMSEVSRGFYQLAENDLFWKQKAIQIGIPDKDLVEATSSSIKEQFAKISTIAKNRHSSSSVSDLITIESLKNNLSEIKCSDFMKVWEEIIKKLSSADLSIPEEVKTIKNPDILDEKFGEWIEDNKDRISSLTDLFLCHLNLSFLPTAIGKLSQLKSLDLRNNQLSGLCRSLFGKLSQLERLELNDNNLLSLPESFGKLGNLKNLHLDNNQLSSLPESFGDLGNLEYLFLYGNQLSSLPDSIDKPSCHITYIMYENNPISLNPVNKTFKHIRTTTCYAMSATVAIISFVAASILLY